MTRFRNLALFVVLAAVASIFVACGGGDSESGNSDADPQTVIEGASLEGVKSGNLDLSMHVISKGKEGGDVEVDLSGPFEAGAKGELPQVEMTAAASGSAQGEDLDFEGGLTMLTDRAFINYEGTAYEIEPTTFGFLKSAFEQSQQRESGESGDITACQEAAEGIKFSQLAEELTNEGSVDVDGTATTKVSGDVDISGGIDALVQLTEDPACKSQLEAAGPLPLSELEEAKGELSKAVEKAHIELYVGDDEIVRKLAVELTIRPPEAANEKIELELEMILGEVNEQQDFSAPSDAEPLEALFKATGISPQEIEGVIEGGVGGLLDSIGGGVFGGSSSGGSSAGPGVSSATRQKYTECLQEARTPADLQKCASLRG